MRRISNHVELSPTSMRVKDLIVALQAHDQESFVLFYDGDNGMISVNEVVAARADHVTEYKRDEADITGPMKATEGPSVSVVELQ